MSEQNIIIQEKQLVIHALVERLRDIRDDVDDEIWADWWLKRIDEAIELGDKELKRS